MFGKITSRNRKNRDGARSALRAQAIVEFAIALPVLLMLLIGLMEVGRLLLIYTMVTNASRDAVRYASAVGLESGTITRYNYCEGIKAVAFNSAFIVPDDDLNIEIRYDHGSSVSEFDQCNVWNSDEVDGGVVITSGDRVTVKIWTTYNPILTLLPIPPRDIESTSSRTILGVVELD